MLSIEILRRIIKEEIIKIVGVKNKEPNEFNPALDPMIYDRYYRKIRIARKIRMVKRRRIANIKLNIERLQNELKDLQD